MYWRGTLSTRHVHRGASVVGSYGRSDRKLLYCGGGCGGCGGRLLLLLLGTGSKFEKERALQVSDTILL